MRSVVLVTVAVSVFVLLGITQMSCTKTARNDSDDVIAKLHRSHASSGDAVNAAWNYYLRYDHWPQSAEDLIKTIEQNGPPLDVRQYENMILRVLQDGRLRMQWKSGGVLFDVTLKAPLIQPSTQAAPGGEVDSRIVPTLIPDISN